MRFLERKEFMMLPIGEGRPSHLRVPVRGKLVDLEVRLGLYGLRSLGVVTGPRAYSGMFIVRNVDRGGWQLVASVYHAYRQTWHILAQYGLDMTLGEKSAMREVAELFHDLNVRVLGLEPRSGLGAYRREISRRALRGAETIGKNPLRPAKRDAKRHLAVVAGGTDRRGRLNPGSMEMRAIAGHRATITRLEREILVIDPHIAARQKAFINMIQIAELYLAAAEEFVSELLVRDGLRAIFQGRGRLEVARNCVFYAEELARLDFHPYRRAGMQTVRDLSAVRDTLLAGYPDRDAVHEIRHALSSCKNALALLHHLVALERTIYHMARNIDAGRLQPLVTWTKRVREVRRGIRAVDESTFRRPVCGKALALVPHVLANLSSKTPDVGAARDTLKEMSAILAGIDRLY